MVSGFRCWVVIAQAPLASIATVPPPNAVTLAAAAPDFRKLRRVTLTRLSMVLMGVSSLGGRGSDCLVRLALVLLVSRPLCSAVSAVPQQHLHLVAVRVLHDEKSAHGL